MRVAADAAESVGAPVATLARGALDGGAGAASPGDGARRVSELSAAAAGPSTRSGSDSSERRSSADSAGTAAINVGLAQFAAELAAGVISQDEYDHIVAVAQEGRSVRAAEEADAQRVAAEERTAAAAAAAAAEEEAKAQQAEAKARAANSKKVSSDSFLWGRQLGTGGFASVVHCRHKASDKEYACKVMRKDFITKHQKMKYVMTERNVLAKHTGHPLLVSLHFAFLDAQRIFLVLDLARAGTLLDFVVYHKRQHEGALTSGNAAMVTADVASAQRACSHDDARFYVAELCVALAFLHERGIVHRDVKPENVLIAADGHLRLTDFGTVKVGCDAGVLGDATAQRTTSFGGTAEYLPPEVLKDAEAEETADIWAVGCVLYQMLVGTPPFRGANDWFTFELIRAHGEREEGAASQSPPS